MGSYTEIFFRANIREDVPDGVAEAIRSVIDGGERPNINHPFFDCDRWDSLATCSSAYFPSPARSFVGRNQFSGTLSVVIHANLKDYDGEIGKFFDWITPYVDAYPGEFLGYQLHEDGGEGSQQPTLYHAPPED